MILADVAPDFWTVTLPAVVTAGIGAIVAVVVAAVTAMKIIVKALRELMDLLQKNTAMTANVVPSVVQQFDSATKETKEAAKVTKDTAETVAIDSAKGQERIISSIKEMATTIKGDDGTCVTARLKKLEDAHARLEGGHASLNEKIDKLTEAVKAVGADVRKQSNY